MSARDEAHRRAQLHIGAATVLALHKVWPLLDPHELDATAASWLAAAIPVIQRARAESAVLAARYLAAARAQSVRGEFAPILATVASPAAVSTSLLVTGPYSIKANMARRAVPLARALDIAEARTGAAGMRVALAGGRETIVETTKKDPRARGWVRIASGNACAFCASLADQEAFTESGAAFEAHDACGCTAAPVYA